MIRTTLTIFTPTYNRIHTLRRTFDSLRNQTNKCFEWLIIDDGSTDDTKSVVERWKQENYGFVISYVYKKNGGLHTAYNKAIELMESELCVCVDSDDFMPENAVQSIFEFWERNKSSDLGGFIGLDYTLDVKPIGGFFPQTDEKIHLQEIANRFHHYGDNKMVLRVDLLKQVAPQPSFVGEKNFNPIYLIFKVDFNYKFKLLNKNLCFVDYQTGGMSNAIYKQYVNSPNSFAALRLISVKSPCTTFPYKIKQYMHYISSKFIANKFPTAFHEGMNPFFVALLTFPGWLLSKYILYKANK